MKRSALRALLVKLGLKTETEIDEALDAAGVTDADPNPAPAPAAAATPATAPSVDAAVIQQVVREATEPLRAELAEAKAAREATQKALDERASADRAAQIAKALDAAVAAGKVETAKREAWQKRLEGDFDGVSAILDEMPSRTAGKGADAKAGESTSAAATVSPTSSLPPDIAAYVGKAITAQA